MESANMKRGGLNEFVVSTFHGVPPKDNGHFYELLTATKEANITHIETVFGSRETTLLALDICDKLGLKVIVQDADLFGGIQNIRVADTTEESAKEAVKLYGKHPSLAGYYIWDEPFLEHLPNAKRDLDLMTSLDGENRIMLVTAQQGTSASYNWNDGSFKNYFDSYLEIVDPPIIASDIYYFMDIDKGQKLEDLVFWQDISYIRKKALERNRPYWYYIQLVGFDSNGIPTDGPGYMTVDKVRQAVYTLLAYGFKGISYYFAMRGLFDECGANKTFLFDGVKQINSEVLALGKTLVNLTSTLVYHTGYVNSDFTDSIGDSQIVKSAPEGLIFGEFESDNGGKYIMITNRSFDSDFKGEVLLKTDYKIYKVNKTTGKAELLSEKADRISLNLIPGNGELFIFAKAR